MKTYREKKTGLYLPEWGSMVSVRPTKNGKQLEIFETGRGHRKEAVSKYEVVEIPDLTSEFTVSQFREYAKQYGFHYAIHFLNTCDYMKPILGRMMLNPSYPDEETVKWGLETFRIDFRHCYVSMLAVFGYYSFDLLQFENHLASVFGYPKHLDGSIADFMRQKFGEENTARFERIFLTTKEDSLESAK